MRETEKKHGKEKQSFQSKKKTNSYVLGTLGCIKGPEHHVFFCFHHDRAMTSTTCHKNKPWHKVFTCWENDCKVKQKPDVDVSGASVIFKILKIELGMENLTSRKNLSGQLNKFEAN